MKKRYVKILCVLLVCLFAGPAMAMDFMVGAKAGYYIWEPFYKDGFGASGMNDIEYGAGVLAGPIFSLLITQDLTFSLAGLAGRQSTHWQSKFSDFDDPSLKISGGYYFDSLRVDIDSALSYRLGEKFKVFAGYKVLYLKTDYKYTEIRSDAATAQQQETDIMDATFITPFHGPAIGIGFSMPIGERVFVSANISGLYMMGYFDDDKITTYNYTNDVAYPNLTVTKQDFKRTSVEQLGLNVEPAIGFNPGKGLPLISIGLRFQWLRVHFKEDTDELQEKWFNDYLYGMFVSAVYLF